MKKNYIKPYLTLVDLRSEERIACDFTGWKRQGEFTVQPNDCFKHYTSANGS